MEEAMDWSAINWLNLSVLTASAFLAALIGSFIGRRNYALTAFLSALIFAAIYIGWFGYLNQQEPTDQPTAQPEGKPSEAPAETSSEAATDGPATEPAETEETAPAEEPETEELAPEEPPAEEAEEP